MPCTYYPTPEETRARERRRLLNEIDEGRALLKVEDQLAEVKADRDKLLTEILAREKLIDQQEQVICKMFNTLFDWGLIENMLVTDKELKDTFFDHQIIDQEQGRPFIAMINGKLQRVQPMPDPQHSIKE